MNHGGPRPNSGRPKLPYDRKTRPVTIRLPNPLADWLQEQPRSQAAVIIDALRSVHKLDTTGDSE